jgi:hypothetical protein
MPKGVIHPGDRPAGVEDGKAMIEIADDQFIAMETFEQVDSDFGSRQHGRIAARIEPPRHLGRLGRDAIHLGSRDGTVETLGLRTDQQEARL